MADYKPESISKYQAGEIETVLLGTILQLESVVIEGNRPQLLNAVEVI